MRKIRSIVCATTLVLLLTSGAWAQTTTLYLEPFDNTTSTGQPFTASTFGWKAYSGTTATDISATTSGGAAFYTNDDVKSPPTGTTDPAAVNTSDPGTTVSFGAGSLPNANFLLYGTPSTTVTADGSSTSNQMFSWYQFDRNNTTTLTRPAIEIGGTFYVYNVTFSSTGNQPAGTGGFGDPTSASLETVSLSSAKWQPLTFTPGSALSYNSATPLQALPPGVFQGLGVYYGSGAGGADVRFDDFTLYTTSTSTPEPGSLGALAFVGMALLRRGR